MSRKKVMSLKSLIKYAISGRSNKKAVHVFFEVSKNKVNLVKKKTGIDITGYKHAIDNYAIQHIILQHGNKEDENKRGLVPVTLDVFDMLPLIIKKPDHLTVNVNKGKVFFQYTKKYKNEIYYIEEILTGRKELTTKTLYIKKSRKK